MTSLTIDKADEIAKSADSVARAAATLATQVAETKKEAQSKEAAEKPPKHHNKKAAYYTFHALNFFGFHVAFNSVTSLLIAYNLLPTKPAKKAMNFMADIATPVNKFFTTHIGTPIAKFVRGSSYKPLPAEEVAAKIAHSARSRVETAFMCIAGFLALWPVKALEDHRAGFMNTVDRFFHPGRSKEEREATDIKPEDTPKETWKNLIQARLVGLVAVFSVDALQQRINNWLKYEKATGGNIDTAVWKLSANFSDKIPNARSKLVHFFERRNIGLGSIQSDMLPHLLEHIDSAHGFDELVKTIGEKQAQIKKTANKVEQAKLGDELVGIVKKFGQENPHLKEQVERAIFAEQSRLLITKELFLTVLISTVIYICAKTPITRKALEKVGLKKKGDDEWDVIAHPEKSSAKSHATQSLQSDEKSTHSTIKHAAHSRSVKPMERHTKTANVPFAERLAQESEIAGAQQLSV